MDILRIIDEGQRLVGDWNGEDSQFISGGRSYTEDDVHIAEEMIEKAKEVLRLYEELG